MAASPSTDPVRDGQGRGKLETRHGRTRSHSISYLSDSLSQWDTSAAASKPLRWYPSHLSPENLLRQSKSTSNFQGLETIAEDIPTQGILNHLGVHERMNFMLDHYDDSSVNHRRSEDISTFISDKRRHSDGDILDLPSPNRYHKRRQQANNGIKRSSNPEIKKSDRPRRKKSYVGVELNPDYDSFSEASDVHSQKSSKSRLSVCSDDSLTSASKLTVRRRSEADGISVGNISKASSQISLVQNEAHGKQGSVNEAMHRTDTVSTIISNNNTDSSNAQPKRHLSILSVASEDPSPFTTLEIPVEFMDISTSRVRKFMSPIVISLIAITLLACLAVAVYFAVVLKDSQERQIEFLEITLRFVLNGEQQAHDISRLTSSQLSELKQMGDYFNAPPAGRWNSTKDLFIARCVDAIYKTSTFTAKYRGCVVETLTSEKIQFKLYFLDGSVPEKQQEDNIIEVLELQAEPVGAEGSQLRKISHITFDISNKTRSVQVEKTKKAEDFHSSSSLTSTNSNSSLGVSVNIANSEAAEDAFTTTTPYYTTTNTISRPIHIYNDDDNKVVLDTICSSLDPTEIVPHPTDCTHYIQCEFMKPIIRPCSGGLVFNPKLKTCVKPSPDLPCSAVQPCNNINGGYFAHPTNCRLYIICDRGRTVVQSCKNDFLWDDVSKTCVLARSGIQC